MDKTGHQTVIEQVNFFQTSGGAARVSWSLHLAYLTQGYDSYLVVQKKEQGSKNVYQMPNEKMRLPVSKKLSAMSADLKENGTHFFDGNLAKFTYLLANFHNVVNDRFGLQKVDFPGTKHLLEIPGIPVDILHLHNLHVDYFDLRQLAGLSRRVPVIQTMHDEWLFTGHCASSIACERWKTGCGNCPDLDRYPSIRKDNTRKNWKMKQRIFQESQLYVTTPSQFLMDRVMESMIQPAIQKARVIPNGVDLSIFKPANKEEFRNQLGLPIDAFILLYIVAGSLEKNPYKDFVTIKNTLELLMQKEYQRKIIFLGVGGKETIETMGNIEIRYIPYQEKPSDIAAYYKAADVYLHAAKAESFSNVVLEARACGTPVIATAVGGITEQLKDSGAGFLIDSEDSEMMANHVTEIMENQQLQKEMSQAGAADARKKYSMDAMISAYLEFYAEAMEDWKKSISKR